MSDRLDDGRPGHRPFVAGPFRWRVGARPLQPADRFELDGDAARVLEHKAAIMAAHPGTALVTSESIEAEATELLDDVVAHLERFHPDWARRPDPTLHPLDAAARLVPDDLVLMVRRHGQMVVGGGSVCAPNRWDLASKVDRPLGQVHEPVPLLNEQLGPAIDRFMERLTPERPYWRLGWGLVDTDELYLPLDGTGPERRDPAHWHLRVERETLVRLPGTGAVVFAIRTHLTELGALLDEVDSAPRLAAAVEALPAEVADYKQIGPMVRSLLASYR